MAAVVLGGFAARFPPLELEPRQSLHGGCWQHFSWCGVRWPRAPVQQLVTGTWMSPCGYSIARRCLFLCTPTLIGWTTGFSGPPSSSVPAAAPSWLVPRQGVPCLRHGYYLSVCSFTRRWLALGVPSCSFGAAVRALAGPKGSGTFFSGIQEQMINFLSTKFWVDLPPVFRKFC